MGCGSSSKLAAAPEGPEQAAKGKRVAVQAAPSSQRDSKEGDKSAWAPSPQTLADRLAEVKADGPHAKLGITIEPPPTDSAPVSPSTSGPRKKPNIRIRPREGSFSAVSVSEASLPANAPPPSPASVATHNATPRMFVASPHGGLHLPPLSRAPTTPSAPAPAPTPDMKVLAEQVKAQQEQLAKMQELLIAQSNSPRRTTSNSTTSTSLASPASASSATPSSFSPTPNLSINASLSVPAPLVPPSPSNPERGSLMRRVSTEPASANASGVVSPVPVSRTASLEPIANAPRVPGSPNKVPGDKKPPRLSSRASHNEATNEKGADSPRAAAEKEKDSDKEKKRLDRRKTLGTEVPESPASEKKEKDKKPTVERRKSTADAGEPPALEKPGSLDKKPSLDRKKTDVPKGPKRQDSIANKFARAKSKSAMTTDSDGAQSNLLNRIPIDRLKGLGPVELDLIWSHFDRDGNGVLDRKEIKAFAQECVDRTLKMFEDELKRANPDISARDLEAAVNKEAFYILPGKNAKEAVPEMVKILASKLDVNKDGSVTKRELMMTWPSVAKELFTIQHQESTLSCSIM